MELKNKEPVKKESRSEKNRARWDHVAKRNQGRSALERSDGNSKVYIYIHYTANTILDPVLYRLLV